MTCVKKVLSFVHDDFEDLELWYPILRLREEGIEVVIAGEEANKKYTGKHGVPAISECSFKNINIDEFHGLLIPGGWAPDKIRVCDDALSIVKHMSESQKVIGQICHAGWVTISADILNGYKVTSTPNIKDDMENAGAIWSDEMVVVDRNLVSSRKPSDLPQYMKTYIETLLK
ncbi:type 1 glutamine amidotransferase domain-containing protein [Clostridium algidicarnis]|uniref:type 1 glutamine amidotransferase domain-containing protein n=1 Tax=Clostridium algidicarnis TaxID=37659 RepID=UPI001C0DDA98|nr:type 1 glutamine amidotransferase domain-containing protein [Clostridium algidicarnis]MBU3210636.1 type 1 glutamine amidotransferase [Clostridium algidicarnis]MBU3228814.1 type 1 glutamine amidotransferase [Clostridium algidicarnis]MBU3252358.1 type 1 glutamine amidotransferase [Clostridium algidicarnis]